MSMKNETIAIAKGLSYEPIESLWGEKPPVETVEKEVQIESYKGTFAKVDSNKISTKVIKR